jgi:hypothetical protein
MKKWIGIAAILICCGVYAMVKISISQYEEANPQEKETPGAKQTDAGDTDVATPGEDSGTAATAEQVEAVTKVFSEFLSTIKSEDYEQAWKLVSESAKSKGSFEKFKELSPKLRAVLVEATIRPESATNIDGRVRLPITIPSGEDGHLPFVQEDGQWKLKLDDL